MRDFFAITMRTTVVLALVGCMPLMALPQVSARVSEWADDLYDNHFGQTNLAGSGSSTLSFRPRPRAAEVDDSIQWQAEPVGEQEPRSYTP